ncbi:hypothetical protein BVU17_04465 [Haloarcula taiwanensis]|uniref:ATP-grasp domain-containing protein n=1 Tax=Haloarcula taiwanensis TaxID=1932004 RepID=A0A2H4ZWF2_9EURY|nr:hypothetical protein [Haloarcula taiwanensis]AUG46808.1 hypothetical protein BVU17_04465 [Haloarcula taiwanensis]
MDCIGFICEPEHPVFGAVAERLSARGFDVQFLRPGNPVAKADIDDLAALVNTTLRPESFSALWYADRTGTETWNGFLPTTALACRLVALHGLEQVGCRVPAVWFEKPDCDYTARTRYSWDGVPADSDEGDFYQACVREEPVEYKYFAVDDGRETHLRAIRVRSEVTGLDRVVSEETVEVTLAARVRELLDRFGARALSVEFVEGESKVYAQAVDPAPGFAGTGMERRVADSIASLTTIGA